MMTWIISSSVLIAAVILLRYALRGRISPRLQYALWAVVLLRLLIPVSFGETAFSVMNVVPEQAASVTADTQFSQPSTLPADNQEPAAGTEALVAIPGASATSPLPQDSTAQHPLVQGLTLLWLAGVFGVCLCFGASNLFFARSLRRSRRPVDDVHADLPVYVTDAIDTPCLFGLFHPAIYVTPEALKEPAILKHVIAHETVHFHHGDHCWAILRGLCTALHWYNPLVWWAAILSRQDGETACDADTIRHLGEAERAAYGRTLIGMTCQKPTNPLVTATTMTGGARAIRERISLIAQKPKMKVCTVVAVLLVAVIAVGCTFSGRAAGGEIPIEHAFADEVPEAAVTYAERLMATQIDSYQESFRQMNPNASIAGAKITALTPIPTGVAGLNDGIELYRLEYRLLVKGTLKDEMLTFVQKEIVDGETWITQSTGDYQIYLLLYWQDTDGQTTWQEAGLTFELTLNREYSTLDMLNQYGNKYTACAAERYNQYQSGKTQRELALSSSLSYEVPNGVYAYAESVILQQADTYHLTWAASGLDCTVIAAEINGLTPVDTGTANNDSGVAMYSLDYTLLVSGDREDLLQTGLASESTDLRYDEARAAYACDGQRFLLLHYQDNGQQDATWTPICTATQETLAQFATEEMLQKYGSEYTAAAMELYTQYLEANQQ